MRKVFASILAVLVLSLFMPFAFAEDMSEDFSTTDPLAVTESTTDVVSGDTVATVTDDSAASEKAEAKTEKQDAKEKKEKKSKKDKKEAKEKKEKKDKKEKKSKQDKKVQPNPGKKKGHSKSKKNSQQ